MASGSRLGLVAALARGRRRASPIIGLARPTRAGKFPCAPAKSGLPAKLASAPVGRPLGRHIISGARWPKPLSLGLSQAAWSSPGRGAPSARRVPEVGRRASGTQLASLGRRPSATCAARDRPTKEPIIYHKVLAHSRPAPLDCFPSSSGTGRPVGGPVANSLGLARPTQLLEPVDSLSLSLVAGQSRGRGHKATRAHTQVSARDARTGDNNYTGGRRARQLSIVGRPTGSGRHPGG